MQEAENFIAVDAITTVQKLKLLELPLHYALTKLRSKEMTEK